MRRTSLLLLGVLALSGPAWGQGRQEPRPGPPGAPDHRPEPRRAGVDDPAEASRLLNRSLQDLEQRRERVREALKKIEQGVPVREAMRGVELRVERGDRRPEGGSRRPAEPGSLSEAMGERMSGPRLDHPPTPEQRDRAKSFLRQHVPDIAAKVEANERDNPEGAERGLMRMIPRIEDAEAVRQSDPRLFELRVREMAGQFRVVEAIRLDREARESKDPGRIEQSTAALRSALAAQMDTRLELQDHEIEALTRRIEELRADVQKKRSTREASIEDMLKRVRDFGERRARERPQGEARVKEGAEPRSHTDRKPEPKR